jgi:hypothetical protein
LLGICGSKSPSPQPSPRKGGAREKIIDRRAAVFRHASMLKVCYRTPDMSME